MASSLPLRRALLALFISSATTSPVLFLSRDAQADDDRSERIERLVRTGYSLTKRNKVEDAIAAFREALSLSQFPDGSLFYNIGKLYEDGQKDCNKALLYYHGYTINDPSGELIADVKVRAGRCRTAVLSTLGRLTVTAKAGVVPIRVDEVPIGNTPVNGFELPAGLYTVLSESDDFLTVSEDATIEVGLETRLDFALKRRMFKGILTVVVDPPDAEIYVDEELVAKKSPYLRKDAVTKTYLIRVERAGWDRWVRYVTVERDSEAKVEVTLEQSGEQVAIPPLPRND